MANLYNGAPGAATVDQTPGSVWAIAAGCLCPPNVNNGGRGMSGFKDAQGRPVFNVHPSCPKHSQTGDPGSFPGHPATAASVPRPS